MWSIGRNHPSCFYNMVQEIKEIEETIGEDSLQKVRLNNKYIHSFIIEKWHYTNLVKSLNLTHLQPSSLGKTMFENIR